MKIRYLDFLKMNENNNIIISIAEIEKIFKNVFDDTKVTSVKTFFDNIDGDIKLIISINNLYYDRTNIIYTKFIFNVDKTKEKIVNNECSYLYDINKHYRTFKFNNTDELQKKLDSILNKEDFGKDIKNLSDMNVRMTSLINEWFSQNKIETISVYNVKYTPLVDNMKSDSLFFKFEINIKDSEIIELSIRKIKDNEFKLTFQKGEDFQNVTISDIRGAIQTIGETIKKYLI
jgi:hypothetical protein